MLTVPPGCALVQTVDILAPIVNDAFAFGRIAAANALSDVYAMGGQPWSAMNVAFFPQALAEDDPQHILENILRGGPGTDYDKKLFVYYQEERNSTKTKCISVFY